MIQELTAEQCALIDTEPYSWIYSRISVKRRNSDVE